MYERLRCGVIYTRGFQDHLEAWWRGSAEANFGLVPELSYIRCKEGKRAGQSWMSLVWRPVQGTEPHEIYQIGPVKLYLAKATRTALKERCLDVVGAALVVR